MKTTWNETDAIDGESLIEAAEMYRQIHSSKTRNEYLQSISKKNLQPPAFESITIDEMKRRLGRKWRTGLRNVTKLACAIENFWIESQLSDCVTIAQTSSMWSELLGGCSIWQASRTVQQALDIGLLKLRTPHEYYNHVAASYWVNHELARQLIEGTDEPSTPGDSVNQQINDTLRKYLSAKFKDESFKATPVSIKSQCKLPPMTMDEAVCGVYERYPQYLDLLLDLHQINSMLPEPDRFLCCPSIDRDKNGNVIRVGLRSHNPWCHVKKREGCEDPFIVCREDLLDRKFGHWVEYDIKACVPSVSLLLTTGRWRDDGEDLYELMSGVRFRNKVERDLFKGLFLPMYFSASPEQAVARSRSKARQHCTDYSKEEWDNLANVFFSGMCKMTKKIGKLGSEIFLHESCIEAKALLKMLKAGWQVVDVYDGFFIKTDGTPEDAETKCKEASRMVKEAAEDYYRKWYTEGE